MSDPADIDIIRGNNYPPAMWQFLTSQDPDVIFPLTGSTMKLTVMWDGAEEPLVPDIDVDLATSIVTWNYTTDDSRSLPLGRLARYEIERWIDDTQQTLIRGFFIASDGNNPD